MTKIVLKTVLNDIIKSTPTSTETTKSLRAWCRVNLKGHDKNAPWELTPTQIDQIRMAKDPNYAKKMMKVSKPRAATKIADKKSGAEAKVINNELQNA